MQEQYRSRESEHLCEFHQRFKTSHMHIVHRLYVYYHVLVEPLRSDTSLSRCGEVVM